MSAVRWPGRAMPGTSWRAQIWPPHPKAPGTVLVLRRHVDYGRLNSSLCRG
ncbi:hypothetical protein MXD61_26470 [Frankia sp. AgPm24]|uniref:hypothetical protein n=1 Tax=Frankia sp. AgPm24 TaxID=631128 RepID=UPI00200E8E10|nr:hypothetical protein [Frankia sp. AgPm24]MCK9925376.1 hypothetical protein [Frankia sp. AgPm24]